MDQFILVAELTSVILVELFVKLGFHVSAYYLQIIGPTEIGNEVLVNLLFFIGSLKLVSPELLVFTDTWWKGFLCHGR